MTTLNFRGKEYNVVLIDPSIETAGDGATPSTALKDLPSKLANNTCYLVRRTSIDYAALVKYQVDTTLINVMLLGMPKETDEQWIQDLVPSTVVNSAWKSDTAEYANIEFQFNTANKDNSSWNKCTVNAANLEDLTCINCYLHRGNPESHTTSSNYRYYLGSFFTNNGSTAYKTNFRFYGCKFGSKYLDLSDDKTFEDMTDIASKNVSPYFYDEHSRHYIIAAYANTFVLKNCIINHINGANDTDTTGSTNSSKTYRNGSAFNIAYVNNVDMKDNVIYSTYSSTSYFNGNTDYGRYVFYFKPIQRCVIDNIKYYNICLFSHLNILE